MKTKCIPRLAATVATAIALIAHAPAGETKERPSLFKDTKNSYFMFVPPTGWRAQEYADARTKVSFNNPDDSRVFLRLIVRDAPNETYESMKSGDEATARTMRGRGIPCKLTEGEFMGAKCVEISAEFPGGEGFTKLRKFMIAGLHFNIQFSAPTKELFDKHLDVAFGSLDTLVVRKAQAADPEKVRAQQIAHYIRYAKLTADVVNVQEAIGILKEAAEKFPESKDVRNALAELQTKAK
jgi:hypothetical protein